MASVRGLLNIQSLNELTYENWHLTRASMVFDTQDTGPAFFGPYVPV